MDQNYPWLEKHLLGKPGAAKEFHQDFQCDRFLVGGKMFAMRGHDRDGRPILTLKLDPGRGEDLRSRYGDIAPGYYMNKLHWNSLFLGGAVPDDIVRGMIDESYSIVFLSLPKKTQMTIRPMTPTA